MSQVLHQHFISWFPSSIWFWGQVECWRVLRIASACWCALSSTGSLLSIAGEPHSPVLTTTEVTCLDHFKSGFTSNYRPTCPKDFISLLCWQKSSLSIVAGETHSPVLAPLQSQDRAVSPRNTQFKWEVSLPVFLDLSGTTSIRHALVLGQFLIW